MWVLFIESTVRRGLFLEPYTLRSSDLSGGDVVFVVGIVWKAGKFLHGSS